MSPVSNAVPFTVTPVRLANIPNREIWLDAAVAASMTIATGVSAWADKTGNGRTMVQATAIAQPALVPNVQNGLPMVRFDGVNSYMGLAGWPVELALGSTFFVVCIPRFVPDAVRNHPLLRFFPGNATGMQEESTADPNVPSRGRLEAFTSTNAGLKRATPAGVVTQTARLQTIHISTTSISLYKDGVLDAGPTGGFTVIVSSLGDLFRLCRADPTIVDNQFGQYDIGEIVGFSRALVAAELAGAHAELKAKWGL